MSSTTSHSPPRRPSVFQRLIAALSQAGGRWTWRETAILAAYVLVVALGIWRHEPWADEAQAWLIARDAGWWQMIAHIVRYEGTPGLWHTLLWILIRLHVSYAGMHWFAAAVAAAGAWVLLRYSPFPLVLRILLPFSFWFAYQDAVIARNYVLFAVLAFSAAALLRSLSEQSQAHPARSWVWLALLLGLLANTSSHGFVASVALAAVAIAVRRRSATRPRVALPALVLCLFWIAALLTVSLPKDIDFEAGKNVEHSLQKIEAALGSKAATRSLASFRPAEVQPGELAPIAPVVHHRTSLQSLWKKVGRFLSLMTFPITTFPIAGLLVCMLAVGLSFRRRMTGEIGWLGFAPWLLLVVVYTSMYIAPRHAGTLYTMFVAGLWMTWPRHSPRDLRTRWLQRITLAALVLISLEQISWTAHAVYSDIHAPYSGSVATAKFLKAAAVEKRVAGFYYHSVGPQPFFSRDIYFNNPHSYWLWSRDLRVNQRAPQTIATHPDYVVVGVWAWSPQNGDLSFDWLPADALPEADVYGIIPYAEAHGYHETHRFCGNAFMRNGDAEELCDVILQPEK
jgi:hypothetical protein